MIIFSDVVLAIYRILKKSFIPLLKVKLFEDEGAGGGGGGGGEDIRVDDGRVVELLEGDGGSSLFHSAIYIT